VVGNGSVSAVFVNGGVGVGTVNPLATLHVYDEGLTGATQVVIQSGANQSGVDLLQWRNNSGDTLGVIRPEGSVVLFYDPPARQAFFAVADPSGVPLIGIGPDPTGWGVGVYDDLTGQLRAGMGKVGTQWRMGVGDVGAQNGVLLNWETTNTDNEPRIVVANGSLATPVFLVDREGDVTVAGNTTLGDAAGDTVRVNARTVELPNIPSGSTATEVLVWKSSDSTVERRAASGLISGFAWMLTGNSITSAWNGSSGNFLGTTNARPLVIATTDTTTPQPIQFWTRNVERMRITEAGEVVVQNRAPNGATKVIIQAGANQGTENLLEWRDNSGDTLGVIDANGLVGIGTPRPVQRLHVEGNGSVSAVFVNGGVGVGTVNPLATLHVYDEGLTGATQVVIQSGANQSGVDLLQWRNNSGDTLGVIRPEGSVVLFYDPPARQAFFAVADPSGVPLIGIGPDPTGWGVGVYDDLTGQLRAGMGKVGTQWRMGVGDVGAQNGVLLNWETTNTDNEPRIVVANGSLATPVFLVDREGDVTVAGNTTLGDAAGDTVRVNAGTVKLPNIPPTAAATDHVLRIDPTTGEVKRSPVAAVISAGIIKGSFPITASGSSFTISVAPADIQLGAIVTVTLVRPSGGTVYSLMVSNIDDTNDQITVVSSGTIPGGAGYAIHYIIINP
jgi:molybdopterin biosynthesis enzyme MoaB